MSDFEVFDAHYDSAGATDFFMYDYDSFKEPSKAEPEALSVSAAMAKAKYALESVRVTIIGEVSEFNNKAGYKAVYFTIKDETASLPCMMWLNRYAASGLSVSVGMLVEVTGKFSLYAAKGRMSFDVSTINIAGEGDLRLKVANLEKKLRAEGLMDASRKRPLPPYPEKIGLVTSPRGAAVHDVLRTLRRRFPIAAVILAGVPVEGAQAAAGMADALQTLEMQHPDVILLVRGGGSFEDLMPFNDENLCRAIAACSIPIVTGIGHEPDTSIADMVADVRASTPTAAAERVSPDTAELLESLTFQETSLAQSLERRLQQSNSLLERIRTRPIFKDPHSLFAYDLQTVDYVKNRVRNAMPRLIERSMNELKQRASRIHDLSPLAVLGRGYSIAQSSDGKIVKSVLNVAVQDNISVQFEDGTIRALITDVEKGSNYGRE